MAIKKQNVVRAGTGPNLLPGQEVTINCIGYGKNGDISLPFWSTKDPHQKPFTFKIGEGSVLRALNEGVVLMQLGELALFECSPDFAYGDQGYPAWEVLPNSNLVFEIEVLSAQ